MKTSRRSVLRALLAIPAIYSTKPFDPNPDDPDFLPGTGREDVTIRVHSALCEDPGFDLPAFLASEVSQIETPQSLHFRARLNELYADTDEVGFWFCSEKA